MGPDNGVYGGKIHPVRLQDVRNMMELVNAHDTVLRSHERLHSRWHSVLQVCHKGEIVDDTLTPVRGNDQEAVTGEMEIFLIDWGRVKQDIGSHVAFGSIDDRNLDRVALEWWEDDVARLHCLCLSSASEGVIVFNLKLEGASHYTSGFIYVGPSMARPPSTEQTRNISELVSLFLRYDGDYTLYTLRKRVRG